MSKEIQQPIIRDSSNFTHFKPEIEKDTVLGFIPPQISGHQCRAMCVIDDDGKKKEVTLAIDQEEEETKKEMVISESFDESSSVLMVETNNKGEFQEPISQLQNVVKKNQEPVGKDDSFIAEQMKETQEEISWKDSAEDEVCQVHSSPASMSQYENPLVKMMNSESKQDEVFQLKDVVTGDQHLILVVETTQDDFFKSNSIPPSQNPVTVSSIGLGKKRAETCSENIRKQVEKCSRRRFAGTNSKKDVLSMFVETRNDFCQKKLDGNKQSYSREEMEELRFVDSYTQRQIWREIYTGLGPVVAKQLNQLSEARQNGKAITDQKKQQQQHYHPQLHHQHPRQHHRYPLQPLQHHQYSQQQQHYHPQPHHQHPRQHQEHDRYPLQSLQHHQYSQQQQKQHQHPKKPPQHHHHQHKLAGVHGENTSILGAGTDSERPVHLRINMKNDRDKGTSLCMIEYDEGVLLGTDGCLYSQKTPEKAVEHAATDKLPSQKYYESLVSEFKTEYGWSKELELHMQHGILTRQKFVKKSDIEEKMIIFNDPGKEVICGYAGHTFIAEQVVKKLLLLLLTKVVTIQDCIEACQTIYAKQDGEETASFYFASHEEGHFKKVHVTKKDGVRDVSKHEVISAGSIFGNMVLSKHYRNNITKAQATELAAKALRASSIARCSGGKLQFITLDRNGAEAEPPHFLWPICEDDLEKELLEEELLEEELRRLGFSEETSSHGWCFWLFGCCFGCCFGC